MSLLVRPIRAELKKRGYVHLHDFVPRDAIRAARVAAIEIGQGMGFLERTSELASLKKSRRRITFEDQIVFAAHLKKTRAYQDLLADPRLTRGLDRILGAWRYYEPRLDQAGVWARFVGPTAQNPVLPPHQDSHYHGPRKSIFGVWFPLEDCPKKLGGLALKPFSHLEGYRPHAGGFLDMTVGKDWYVDHYREGDCLIFSNLCVHGPIANRYERRARLSVDFRVIVRGATVPQLRRTTTSRSRSGSERSGSRG